MPRFRLASLALAAALAVPAKAPAAPAPAAALEELLGAARRSLRGESPRRPEEDRPVFEVLEAAGGLYQLRLTLARAAAALAASDGAAAALLVKDVDSTPIGLPGLAEWTRLSARLVKSDAGAVPALLAYAQREAFEPLAREARGAAARTARTPAEKLAVREAWELQPVPASGASRAAIARALALARVAESPAHGKRILAALAAEIPDAPERAPDDFDEVDLAAFATATRTASESVRLSRARVLAPRAPKEATALLKPVPVSPEGRLSAAEVHLLAGGPRDALAVLRRPRPLALEDPALTLHAAAVELSAELRLVGTVASPRNSRRGRARSLGLARRASLTDAVRIEGRERLLALDRLLSLNLAAADRTRLLADGLRAAVRLERPADARRHAEVLAALDPSSVAGADDLFQEGFAAYQAGKFADAVRVWDEVVRLYRDVNVKRRATYWSARARERAGDPEASALYARLLPGSSADLYAVWAAAALGVPLPEPMRSVPESGPPLEGTLSGTQAGAPASELLACGFPDLAEDAAEKETDRDLLFLAAISSELGEHRRAIALLKRRYPELGTPEEFSVPVVARRAFYPLGHAEIVTRVAAQRGLPPALLFALIRQESVFQPAVTSRAGALGLMQVMPATGRFLYRREKGKGRPDLLDPEENVRLGASYLADLLAASSGDSVSALAAYNAGPGRLRQWKKAYGFLPPDEFLESIPLSEPRVYVKRVLFYEGAYAALYEIPALPAATPRQVATNVAPAR